MPARLNPRRHGCGPRTGSHRFLGYFYITVLPMWLGLHSQGFDIGLCPVARTDLLFLGIPLAAG